jgi:hypothetical protein
VAQIYKTIVGSMMHGLNTADSDEDIRYITMQPIRDIISPFKHETIKVQDSNGEDVESWELRHFVKHLTQGNPTVFEVIKSPLYDKSMPFAESIRSLMPLAFDARKILMAHAGYAEAQLKRYLRKAMYSFKQSAIELHYEFDDHRTLLNTTRYENVNESGFGQNVKCGVWEENHIYRIPKSVVAGYRVLAQGRQLLETGDFQPVIKDYSPKLHDDLMSIKTMDANTITWGFVQEHLNGIESGIKELHSYFDSLPEPKKNTKPNIDAIEDALCEIYGVK